MSRTIRLSFGVMFLSTVVLLALFPATRLNAQQQQQQDQQGTSTAAPSQQQKTPDESGGPQGDIGPYAIPKKKDENGTPPPPPPKPKVPEGMPSYSLTVDVPTVNLDVMVTTKDGQFIPGLQKEHFRVLEDGVPQQIQSFTRTEAPITAVLL